MSGILNGVGDHVWLDVLEGGMEVVAEEMGNVLASVTIEACEPGELTGKLVAAGRVGIPLGSEGACLVRGAAEVAVLELSGGELYACGAGGVFLVCTGASSDG